MMARKIVDNYSGLTDAMLYTSWEHRTNFHKQAGIFRILKYERPPDVVIKLYNLKTESLFEYYLVFLADRALRLVNK